MYSFFASVTVRENKPPLESGLSGSWLVVVVATQSISVLGTLLASQFGSYREPLLFFTLCMFLLGMYTVCTVQLSKAISFEPLLVIPRYFVFIALAAWLAAFVGLVHSLLPWKAKAHAVINSA